MKCAGYWRHLQFSDFQFGIPEGLVVLLWNLESEVVTFAAGVFGGFVAVVTLFAGCISQMGIMGIRPDSRGLHGQLFGISMALEAGLRLHRLLGRTFLVACRAIQAFRLVFVPEELFPLCLHNMRQDRQKETDDEEETADP
jgi:hypothetical protein